MVDSRFFENHGPFSLEDVIKITGTKLYKDVDGNFKITSVAPLSVASNSDLSFFSNSKYQDEFKNSKAGVCITFEKFAALAPSSMIVLVAENPNKAYALATSAFHGSAKNSSSISPSAFIGDNAKIGENTEISHHAIIEEGAIIGKNSQVGYGAVIGRNVVIGDNAKIAANVVITHCVIGNNVIIHPGAKIGQDGFGFASDHTGHLKILQLGRVVIGNDVEIGANTTIDRGAGPDTIIGDMTKIDNLVQIGHNVKIGKGCIIVSQVGIAGSTVIEDFVVLGGQVGVSGHIKIGSFAQVAAQSGIVADVEPKKIIGGTPAVSIKDWHRQTIMLKKLIKKTNQ